MNNIIRKHELTRPDKEKDRKNHVRTSGMNYEPVFFTYPAVQEIDEIVSSVVEAEPDYDFIADDRFPAQIQLSVRSVGWVESEVNDWINKKIEQRNNPPSNISKND